MLQIDDIAHSTKKLKYQLWPAIKQNGNRKVDKLEKSVGRHEDKAAHALTVLLFSHIWFLVFCPKNMYNSLAT